MKIKLPDKDYNLDELCYNIQKFEALNNRYPSYIVMNERTLPIIECNSQYYIGCVGRDINYKHNDSYIEKYIGYIEKYIDRIFGIPIAYNNGLDVGMVDIV